MELWFAEDTTPFYAIPVDDVDLAAMPDTARDVTGLPVAAGTVADRHTSGSVGSGPLPRVSVRWESMDAWFEEDEPVFVHPRDPYQRVDVFASDRVVHWELDGAVLGVSRRAVLLCETGMPGRWYLPAVDVDRTLLRSSDTTSGCPYKGEASYWSATVHGVTYPDAVWCYPRPLPEAIRVAGLLCGDPGQIVISVDGVCRPPEAFHPRWLSPSLWL